MAGGERCQARVAVAVGTLAAVGDHLLVSLELSKVLHPTAQRHVLEGIIDGGAPPSGTKPAHPRGQVTGEHVQPALRVASHPRRAAAAATMPQHVRAVVQRHPPASGSAAHESTAGAAAFRIREQTNLLLRRLRRLPPMLLLLLLLSVAEVRVQVVQQHAREDDRVRVHLAHQRARRPCDQGVLYPGEWLQPQAASVLGAGSLGFEWRHKAQIAMPLQFAGDGGPIALVEHEPHNHPHRAAVIRIW